MEQKSGNIITIANKNNFRRGGFSFIRILCYHVYIDGGQSVKNFMLLFLMTTFYLQVKDEVAKLLELKAQLGEDPGKGKFVLKCPKVKYIGT